MMILAYYADDQEQDWIDSIITHQGVWQNPEDGFYCIHEPTDRTVMMFGLMGIEYWYEEVRQNV